MAKSTRFCIHFVIAITKCGTLFKHNQTRPAKTKGWSNSITMVSRLGRLIANRMIQVIPTQKQKGRYEFIFCDFNAALLLGFP